MITKTIIRINIKILNIFIYVIDYIPTAEKYIIIRYKISFP